MGHQVRLSRFVIIDHPKFFKDTVQVTKYYLNILYIVKYFTSGKRYFLDLFDCFKSYLTKLTCI